MTTRDKAMHYLGQPEFQNRTDGFMVLALVRKFGLGRRWAEGIVWDFRRKEVFGMGENDDEMCTCVPDDADSVLYVCPRCYPQREQEIAMSDKERRIP